MNQNRVTAGRAGKIDGHTFEHKVARVLGVPDENVDGGGHTKVDIADTPYGNLSLKNPSNVNTQVYLTSPSSFKRSFSFPSKVHDFIDLFFGQVDESYYYELLAQHGIDPDHINQQDDRRRLRVSAQSIPEDIVDATLDWLNSHKDEMFDLLFAKGPAEWGSPSVDTLGWAMAKNDPLSVAYYSIDKMRRRFQQSQWIVAGSSGSTLWCTVEGKKLLHLQMKGSGLPKIVGWGYHGVMYHMHRTGLFDEDLI